MVKLELPRGMRDLEAEELGNINYVKGAFFETARLFNFRLMEPTPLEMLATLEAKSGASISNEIYAFEDKGGRKVALRFDLTIGLTRYVASRRDLKMPAKIAAFAGVWRYDEPQAGRYRYFHQWDIEVYGPFSQESDAEVIEFVASFFRRLGLSVIIEVNDRQLVEQYIRSKLGISSEEAVLEMFRAVDKVPKKGPQAVLQEYQDRIEPEKLQALIDLSKVKGTAEEVALKVPGVRGLPAWEGLAGLMRSLAARGVASSSNDAATASGPGAAVAGKEGDNSSNINKNNNNNNVRINLGIVRGLDYYSGIVFEVFDPSSGGGALVGGGRYDRLTDAFGRKEIGATGAAGGVERIVMALQRHGLLKPAAKPLVYVAYASEDVRAKALEIASALRGRGIAAECDMLGRALRKQLDDASMKGASDAVIVAPAEIAEGKVIVRSMKDGTESRHGLDGLAEMLASRA